MVVASMPRAWPAPESLLASKCSQKDDQGAKTEVRILDIRTDTTDQSLREEIMNGLCPGPDGQKTLPTLLLYDEQGLKLFEAITYLDEYYLTEAEIELLNRYADRIAERISSGSMVVELGSGYDDWNAES